MVAASRWVRDSNSNMKWKGLDDHLVLGLEKEASDKTSGEVEAVRRNGDGAAVGEIEGLLTKIQGLRDEATAAACRSRPAPPALEMGSLSGNSPRRVPGA